MTSAEVGVLVAGLLTIAVFTYLLADNPVYRLVEHIFIGASLGWVVVMLVHSVLVGRVAIPLWNDPVGNLHLLIPLALGILLLSRLFVGSTWVSNSPVALLVGIGLALAVGGALSGMLIPQIIGTARPLLPQAGENIGWWEALGNLVIVIGVIGTLVSFRYTRPRAGLDGRLTSAVATAGRYTMMVAFGAFFASVALARISLLVGRVSFLVNDWLKVFG